MCPVGAAHLAACSDRWSDAAAARAAVWATTGAELGAIGGEGLRLYFTLIKGLAFIWLAMAVVMCGPLALNAGGEMYKLQVSSHFSDLYFLEATRVAYPGDVDKMKDEDRLKDRQAWRSLRAGTTLGAITRSRSTILPKIELPGGARKRCWGSTMGHFSDVAGDGVPCDCIPGFVPPGDDVGELASGCAHTPSHPLCSGMTGQTCPAGAAGASGRRLEKTEYKDDDGNDAGAGRRRRLDENSCLSPDDGFCDEDDGTCDPGTDCTDCDSCGGGGDGGGDGGQSKKSEALHVVEPSSES
jgi:hypothetical protein